MAGSGGSGRYFHSPDEPIQLCYNTSIISSKDGIWRTENPLTETLSRLTVQLVLCISISRAIFYLLRPLYAPRIVADILGGILLGPTALQRTGLFLTIFPIRGILTLETLAHWALTCHMFLVGLEMDITMVYRSGKKGIYIAMAVILIPFLIGIGLFHLYARSSPSEDGHLGCFFWGAMLSVTGFPTVIQILSELSLLHSDIGRMAMSTSIVNELISWTLVAMLTPVNSSMRTAAVSFPLTVCVGVFSFLLVRPFLAFMIRHTSNGNTFSDTYLCSVLVSVLILATASEVLGINSITGAFIYGIIMPNRDLARVLLERFDDFVTGYLLPLFFAVCGIRINLLSIKNWGLAVPVVTVSCTPKILGAVVACVFFCNMTPKEGFALGTLMNTKGISAITILKMGYDKRVLMEEEYAVMVLALLLMTVAVAPLVASIYRPAKRRLKCKGGTLQRARPDAELRVLVCLQNFRNVPGIINLIDSFSATKESPLYIFALHIMELTGRAFPMLIVHNSGHANSINHHSQQIITELQNYANQKDLVSIQPLTALSSVTTMHRDIRCLAEDKQIAFLILPFHLLTSADGKSSEEGNVAFRSVNTKVLANAPCTVGIFVDRGFGHSMPEETNLGMRHVAMLFFGGPDDREALAIARRMAGSQGVSMTVVRFVAPGDREVEPADPSSVDDDDRQLRLDEDCVNEFRLKSAGEEFVSYEEKVVNNDQEAVSALKEMNHIYDLYVVGKGEGAISPLIEGLLDWCAYPELGPIGDLLVTSSFTQGSVLVVQEYSGTGIANSFVSHV